MIISVQDDLTNVKNNLKGMGYEVYDLSEGNISDVYIYSEKTMGMYNLYNAANPTDNGALLINADDKSARDIVYIINSRLYSPLF